MKLFDNLKSKAAIRGTADHFGQTPEQVRLDMQEAIDEAWATADPAAKALQEQLFPAGKPTPEQFIATVARYMKDKRRFAFLV